MKSLCAILLKVWVFYVAMILWSAITLSCADASDDTAHTSWNLFSWLLGEGTSNYAGESEIQEDSATVFPADDGHISSRPLVTTTAKILDNLSAFTMVTPLLCCLIVYVFINGVRQTWAIDKPSSQQQQHAAKHHSQRHSDSASSFSDVTVGGIYKDMTIPARHPKSKSIRVTGKFGLGLM